MQELFVDKIHSFQFLSLSDKPRVHQLKIITSSRSKVQASLTAWLFSSVPGNNIKEGEIPYVENKYKTSTTYQARWNFLLHSLTCIWQVFAPNLAKWSKEPQWSPSFSKSTNRVSSIPFVGNPHFSILLQRVRYLENLFMPRR